MVHFCLEIHLGRFERVIRREVDRDEEETALVRTIRWANDGGVPVENVIVRPRPGAAGRRGILLEILLRVENTRIVVVSRFARF